jgi:nucleotide-binding universal stress UspA family protein
MNKNLTRILCPIDFSEKSLHALRAAYTLALCFSAEVIAVFVMPGAHTLRIPGNKAAHHRMLDAYYAEKLDLAVRQLPMGGADVETVLLRGYGPDAIVNAADSFHADAILMADEEKNDWESVRDGSTLEEVAKGAPCPVYVLRTLGNDEEFGGSGIIRLS